MSVKTKLNKPLFTKDLEDILSSDLKKEEPLSLPAYYSINLAGLKKIASFYQITLNKAILFALENGVWPQRFEKNYGFLTIAEQTVLFKSKIAVIGCGGLGGSVIMSLARIGIGGLIICDGDVFSESNLNRQILSREDNLGENKAEIAKKNLSLIASHLEIKIYPFYATSKNLPSILKGSQIVVDCLDNLPARIMVEKASLDLGLPFIHGALGGVEGFMMVSRPGAANLVKLYDLKDDSVAVEKKYSAESKKGMPTMTPALIANLQVFILIEELLGRPFLEKSLWHLDLSEPILETLYL